MGSSLAPLLSYFLLSFPFNPFLTLLPPEGVFDPAAPSGFAVPLELLALGTPPSKGFVNAVSFPY